MVCCCDNIGIISRLAVLGFTGLAVRHSTEFVRHASRSLCVSHSLTHLIAQIFLQIMATADCEFMKYESDDFDGTIGLMIDNDDLDKCPRAVGAVLSDTEDLDDDPYMRAARSMLTMSIVFGFGAACLVCFEFLCCRICCAAVLESLALTGAATMGGLAYLSFGSEYCTGDPQAAASTAKDIVFGDGDVDDLYKCSFGKGCSMNLTAMVIYLAAAAVLCCTPKPSPLLTK